MVADDSKDTGRELCVCGVCSSGDGGVGGVGTRRGILGGWPACD